MPDWAGVGFRRPSPQVCLGNGSPTLGSPSAVSAPLVAVIVATATAIRANAVKSLLISPLLTRLRAVVAARRSPPPVGAAVPRLLIYKRRARTTRLDRSGPASFE